jgi:ubiquinol-cytochrome c reductase cytochrome c subunit
MRTAVIVLALAFCPTALAAAGPGYRLYAANCSMCHGTAGAGIADKGPSLRGVGALSADFYLRTGYMPLGHPGEQPKRSSPAFPPSELDALIAYVASLGKGPPVPHPDPPRGSVAEGSTLFTEHCAGCHQIAARGGYLPGATAPPLDRATATQIAEAVRIGPYVMPSFSKRAITNRQLDSIVAYVEYTRKPRNPGGWSIGRIGPIPEGMVAWLIAGTVLVACCVLIGERARK